MSISFYISLLRSFQVFLLHKFMRHLQMLSYLMVNTRSPTGHSATRSLQSMKRNPIRDGKSDCKRWLNLIDRQRLEPKMTVGETKWWFPLWRISYNYLSPRNLRRLHVFTRTAETDRCNNCASYIADSSKSWKETPKTRALFSTGAVVFFFQIQRDRLFR